MKAIYSAIFLTQQSQEELKYWAEKHFEGLLEKEYCHHCTLQFKPANWMVDKLPLGTEVKLVVHAVGADEHCQAVMVVGYSSQDRRLMREYCTNATPHVTISTDSETKPVYSNSLLGAKGRMKTYSGPVLRGKVGIFTADGEKFEK